MLNSSIASNNFPEKQLVKFRS